MERIGTPDTCGVGIRGVAIVIDSVIWFALVIVTTLLTGYVTGDIEQTANGVTADLRGTVALVSLGLWIALSLTYHIVTEWRYGRTLGKHLVAIKVVGEDGRPPSLWASLVRNVLRLVDFFPGGYLVGIALVALSERSQRLGDRLGGTLVVRK